MTPYEPRRFLKSGTKLNSLQQIRKQPRRLRKEGKAKQAAEAKAHSELLTALEGIENQPLMTSTRTTITDKEAAIKAAKE